MRWHTQFLRKIHNLYLSIATPEIVKPEMPPKRVVRRKLRTKDSSDDEEDMVFTSGSDDTSDLSLDESDLTSSTSEESDSVTKKRHDKMVSRKRNRGHVSILNLVGRKFFLPSNRKPIGTFLKILLSKSQKLRGATAPLAPPLTWPLWSILPMFSSGGIPPPQIPRFLPRKPKYTGEN